MKPKAEDIYWVLARKTDFVLNCEYDADYSRLKIERVKIANRYAELKQTHSSFDAKRIATVEWLEEYLRYGLSLGNRNPHEAEPGDVPYTAL